MDAFAVSICKGLSLPKISIKSGIKIALWFGSFQAIMPVIGYVFGNTFKSIVGTIDSLIAFVILTFIGINMVIEAGEDNKTAKNDNIGFKTMFILAFATSIDALTIGVTLSFFEVNIWVSASIIGFITLILTFFGTVIGNKFGNKYQKKGISLNDMPFLFASLANYSATASTTSSATAAAESTTSVEAAASS